MVEFPEVEDSFEDNPDRLCPAAYLYFNGFEDEAKALRDSFGGVDLYIPKRPQPNEFFAKTVGMEAALFLAKELGGCRYFIRDPKREERRLWANVALFSLARIPASVIALLLRTRERNVYRLRRAMRERGVTFPTQSTGRDSPYPIGFMNRKVK